MADAPKFALYVSSVEGRLASRPGSPHDYIGAAIPTPEERKAGKRECTWTPDVVVPVLEDDFRRYEREWRTLVRDGDLKERTAEDFAAYQTKAAEAEAEHVKRLEAAAAPPKTEAEGTPLTGTVENALPPVDGTAEREAPGTGTENTAVEGNVLDERPSRRKRGE
jgi:hypothetical protein